MAAPAWGAARPRSGLRGWTVATVRGVPIRVHWTLVVALPFFAWIMATAYFGDGLAAWLWGAGLAVALFASVAVHELAHTFVAMRRGTRIREIILLPIGGASMMEQPSREPRAEFAIAIVGPLTSLALAALFLGLAVALGVPLVEPRTLPSPSAFLVVVGYLNGVLGLFNLLVPAFPMDGGRVLRAALASRMGLLRATRVAASVGRGFAFLMGAGGILVGNVILILIAVFVWAGARTEEEAVVVSTTLEGVTVGDLMGTDPATIDARASIQDALDVMLGTKHLTLPVTREGLPVAVITADQVAHVPAEARASLPVEEVASPGIRMVTDDQPAPDALGAVLSAGIVAVVDAAGRLRGVITPTDVVRVVHIRALSG